MLSISCPSGPVAPRSQVVVTGSTSDCANTGHNVKVDGNDLPHDWSCTNGDFTITCEAPACDPTGSNTIQFEVTLNGDEDSCSVAIDCP